MQKPISNSNPFYNNINTNTYIDEVIIFIEQKLNLFPDYIKKSSVLQNLQNTIEGEDLITENLCVFFTAHKTNYTYQFDKQDNYDFQFINQSKEKGHRTNDVGVILANTKGNLGKILVIEAKRLPTPGSNREKEYVGGNLGGIERFKKEVHSQEIPTNKALIIGYLQKENSSHWHSKINEWIDEEIKESSNPEISWLIEDKLVQNTSFSNYKIAKYNSIHSRITLGKINLTHYWIDLS